MNCKNCCKAIFALSVMLTASRATAQNTTAPITTNSSKVMAAPGNYVPWKPIRETDIIRKRRIWEKISLADLNNSHFAEHKVGMGLMSALFNGVINDTVKAYSNVDDRFTRILTKDELMHIMATQTQVSGYMIKEDSLWLNDGAVTVRILGIAPLGTEKGTDNEQPIFWVFYPDSHPYLAACTAIGSYSWDYVMEHRDFAGSVTKVRESPMYRNPVQK